MNRVLVIGSGGSGKTTVAKALSLQTGLPLIHLDSLYWRPGWEPTPREEWSERVQQLVSQDRWIIDGNYSGTLDLRLEACDTVVFLDLPPLTCLWRVLKRQARYAGRVRPELPAGCPERLTWEFLTWVWTYRSRRRPEILRKLATLDRGKRTIILRSSAETATFMAGGMRQG